MAKAGKSADVNKKLRRKQAQFLKHEPISDVSFQESPSCHVFVANGGLQNGLSRELLVHLLTPTESAEKELKELYLPAGKDYAFATFESPKTASTAVTSLNGVCIQEECSIQCAGSEGLLKLINPKLLSGPSLHLYLCFIDKVPQACINPPVLTEGDASDLPPGLVMLEEFVSEVEERELLDFFSATANSSDHSSSSVLTNKMPTQETTPQKEGEQMTAGETTFQAPENFLKHRYVKHYGYEFLYSSSNVDPDCPLPGGLPAICRPLLMRMREERLVEEEPDQLTVNHYQPGAGIPPHVDTHSAFEGSIISLSLGSHVVMDFRHPDSRKTPVFLQRRSLLVMARESRYLWTHGIAARQCDEVHSEMPGYRDCKTTAFQSRASTATILPRGTRVSLTFRKVRRKPCICVCSYPLLCDSQQQQV